MFNRIADGILGLFLFFSHWLSPGGDSDKVTIVSVRQSTGVYSVLCAISVDWNEQMKDLIDAGIPVRFHFRAFTTENDTLSCIRTLQCNVADYSYRFIDSVHGPHSDSAMTSKRFEQLLVALEKFTQWEMRIPVKAKACRIEAELLPSRATRLNQKIDMSQVCGCRLYAANLVLKRSP
jgi:hypothetical protein